MLEFNQEQINALNGNARHAEAVRLMPIMRECFAEHTQKITNQELLRSINQALNHASNLGIQTRTASVNYVILWILLGPSFENATPIKRHFSSPGPSIDTKINSLISEFKWQLKFGSSPK